MGWIITFSILFLLAILPLGVRVRYNADGPLVKLIIGPVRLQLVPGKKKAPKKKKEKPVPETAEKGKPEKKEKKAKAPKEEAPKPKQVGAAEPPKPAETPEKKEQGGSILDFLPLVKTLFEFLGDFRRKLRIKNLYLKLVMAGGDPYNLAMNYGKAWAATGNLLPKLENWFVIKKRDIEVECDFVAEKTTIIAHMDISITLGRLLAAVCKFAWKALIKYLQIKKRRKGGAVNEPDVT